VNCGILLAYVTANVQNGLSLREMQQHCFRDGLHTSSALWMS